MSRFHAFSPEDLEELVADLLGSEAGVRYEIFARGRDHGIDLRCRDGGKGLEVVQVKHYERSSFSSLRTAAGKEKVKPDALDPRPDVYRFVTSQDLTVNQKDELVAELEPYVGDADEILGLADLELLLRAHPEVERRHPKLWLTSSTHLADMVHSDVRNRSGALLADIEEALPTYVRHARFAEAQERLHEGRVLIIAGDPGVGKTTLAHMLIADAIAAGFDEPIAVSRHSDEIRRVLDTAAGRSFSMTTSSGVPRLSDWTRTRTGNLRPSCGKSCVLRTRCSSSLRASTSCATRHSYTKSCVTETSKSTGTCSAWATTAC